MVDAVQGVPHFVCRVKEMLLSNLLPPALREYGELRAVYGGMEFA